MPIRDSIGTRVLGLAVVLLMLTIALVVFLLNQVDRLQGELTTLTRIQIPLAASFSRLDEYGLRRRVAFERALGTLNMASPDAAILEEATTNLGKFTDLLGAEFARARELLESQTAIPSEAADAIELRTLLRQVEAEYPALATEQEKVLSLQRAGQHAEAYLLLDGLNEMQNLLQTQRAEMQNVSARRAERVATQALKLQDRIVRLTIAATISTVLLGLLIAVIVTRALVRPVHSLIGALADVQKGKLDLELPVPRESELGALTTAFNFFVRELRAKEQMRETFGRYVDPRILERLLDMDVAADAGVREIMTVSFGDLAGFTSISERLTPANMVGLLNRHFALQAQAVQEHQGVVDKFIGDSIMSFWGPPFVVEANHSVLACRSALAQLAALDTLRRELPDLTGLRRDTPEIEIRIGIATGEVIVGNIGSKNARSYTVIGDNVNLASRLEGANRYYGTRILVSAMVARDVGPQFELREIDTIAVKGKIETESVFELLGEAGCLDENAQRARDAFAEGLSAYRAGNWVEGEAAFSASLLLQPNDRASRVMLERISRFEVEPPDGPWDGVWRFETK